MRHLGTLLTLMLSATVAQAEDWPQWMGPNRDGLTSETGLLQEWPEAGPESAWLSREVGLGYSAPAVVGGRLYLMGARENAAGDQVEQLLALDAETGDELWSVDLSEPLPNGWSKLYLDGWGVGPRGTPTVVGDRIYCLASEGTLMCVSTSGQAVWRVQLTELGGEIPKWGYSESPLVHNGRVIVTPGGSDGAIAAFDASTGEPLWRCSDLDDTAHYSSCLVATINGQEQCLQLLETRLVGIDPNNGDLLWQADWPGRVAVIPTPLVKGNQVYVTTGYGVGCMLVEIAPDNTATVVYDNKAMKNHHGGVVLLGDHLYGHSDGVGWLCQDFATGKRVWRERSELGKGAIAYADGRLYCLDEGTGELVLIEASPNGWTEHGRFTLTPQTNRRSPSGKVWTHPVIANGRLYLRDQEILQAYNLQAN